MTAILGRRAHGVAGLAVAVAIAGCVDFDRALDQCAAQGRCVDADGGRHVSVRFLTVHHFGSAQAVALDAPEAELFADPFDPAGRAPVSRDAGRADFEDAPNRFLVRATRAASVFYVDTVLERVELTVHRAGRPDVPTADGGSVWRFDATGLAPGGLGFHGVVAGTGLSHDFAFERDAGTVALDWSGLPFASDPAFVTQRAARVLVDDAGAVYDQVGIARAASGAPFDPTLAFTVPPQRTLPVDWRREAFRALLPHPAATLAGSTLTLAASVFPFDAGVAAPSAPLAAQPFAAEVVALRPRGSVGELTASIDFAQPYPADWPLVATAVQRFRLARTLSDGGQAFEVGVARRTEAVGAALGPVWPGLALPTGVTIAGAPFDADQDLAHDHPLVAWKPPPGEDLRFTLTLTRLDPDGKPTPLATFHTTRSALRIPTGLMTQGLLYTVRLTTRSTGAAVDPDREPFTFGLPVSEVDLLSGTLRLP